MARTQGSGRPQANQPLGCLFGPSPFICLAMQRWFSAGWTGLEGKCQWLPLPWQEQFGGNKDTWVRNSRHFHRDFHLVTQAMLTNNS